MTALEPNRDLSARKKQSQSVDEAGKLMLGSNSGAVKPLHLLVVDDDEAIQDSMNIFLTLAGHEVTVGSCVFDAVNYVSDKIPDVLIADFWLAGETGLDVIRSVREAANALIPIIILTGDTSRWQIEEAKLPNCQVMHKPADMNNLLAVAHSLHATALTDKEV